MNGFAELMGTVARVFEATGVIIVIAGVVLALVRATMLMRSGGDLTKIYPMVRATFGRGVLLGLEVLVAADIVRTVAIDPTLSNLSVLALLVVIRTFLSWSLEVEIDGRWPWQRHKKEAA